MQRRPVDISRDDAREVATIALLLALSVRIGAGVVKAVEEATREYTWQSIVGEFLAPVGSSLGLMSIGAILIVVLSPNGSITAMVQLSARLAAFVVMTLGAISTIFALTNQATVLTGLWISMINGLSAAILGGAGWWIIRNFNNQR